MEIGYRCDVDGVYAERVQFRNICGVQIGIADIENLVNKGKTSLIKGMKSKAGKKFDAYIVLDENCKTSFEFENKKSKRQ